MAEYRILSRTVQDGTVLYEVRITTAEGMQTFGVARAEVPPPRGHEPDLFIDAIHPALALGIINESQALNRNFVR